MLNYFVIAGIFTILPVATIKVFGNKHGPYIYVFVMLGALVADWCNLALIELVLPHVSFLAIYSFCAVTAFGCLIILWRFKEELDYDNLRNHNGLVKIYSKVNPQTSAKLE